METQNKRYSDLRSGEVRENHGDKAIFIASSYWKAMQIRNVTGSLNFSSCILRLCRSGSPTRRSWGFPQGFWIHFFSQPQRTYICLSFKSYKNIKQTRKLLILNFSSQSTHSKCLTTQMPPSIFSSPPKRPPDSSSTAAP